MKAEVITTHNDLYILHKKNLSFEKYIEKNVNVCYILPIAVIQVTTNNN